ncbi:Fused isobutyryl-CoA mutase [Streptomyces cyaneofuscatus]
MKEILDAIQSQDSTAADFAALSLPESYRAITVHKDEAEMFAGLESRDKDPRKSLHLDEVPVPELGPGEALVAVMASSVNYNSVWTSIFEPVSTFSFLERYGKLSELTKRHDLPYHVIGSDLAGVVLRTGPGVNAWNPGDEVVAHCLSVELESSDGHNDTMLDPEQRIWGFETNFGGLAEIALVKSNQLMPKPQHLSWEEAAAPGLVNSTAYRQLVSRNGAGMKQGDNVLIWGASGGLGSYATQFALAGGANPICVVSSPEKADICRSMGAEAVIDRNAEGNKLMEATVERARAGVTTGEWSWALRDVFGEFRAPTGVSSAPVAVTAEPGSTLALVREKVTRTAADLGVGRLRLLVGKPGLDGHSNGAEQIAVRARDAGFEVVYQGIRLTPEQITDAALAEDVHCVGLSILSGSHAELVPDVLHRLREAGAPDIPVIAGGIIPPADAAALIEAGVAAVFTPKDFGITEIIGRIVDEIRKANKLDPLEVSA